MINVVRIDEELKGKLASFQFPAAYNELEGAQQRPRLTPVMKDLLTAAGRKLQYVTDKPRLGRLSRQGCTFQGLLSDLP
jgi:hypothetical protein